MKFIFKQKDITTEDQGIIVHGVNCQGVMGSGVALAIRRKWPRVYDQYIDTYKMMFPDKMGLLGAINIVEDAGPPNLTVINAFTQFKYGNDGKAYASLSAIRTCFKTIANRFPLDDDRFRLKMPMIGCGLGGLEWEDVKDVVKSQLKNHTDIVEVYYI